MPNGGLLVHLITALIAALIGAAVALRLRQPLIVGYVIAGMVISPFTPGFVGATGPIAEIAELGVIFLMFAIGAQLSIGDLLRASRLAIVGGLVQVIVLVGIGYAVGRALGWSHAESYAFGAVISNSSSAVLSKVLGDRGEIESQHTKIGVAWSSVQDISTVALVAVMSLFGPTDQPVLLVLGKAALFFFVLVPLAVGVLPWVLRRVTAMRSHEVFALAVVTLALGMAAGASLLGVSLALGAFLAGVVVGSSDLAHRILGDAIPLRDVFSGIFFVSIGMLLNPEFVIRAWPLVLLTVAMIVLVKGTVVVGIARWLGTTPRLAVLVGAALAQSGEFSFLMARVGLQQGVLSTAVFNLLLSAAVMSILLSPLVNEMVPRLFRRVFGVRAAPSEAGANPERLEGHAIVCGYGRVGSIVCDVLRRMEKPFVVIEEDFRTVEALRAQGVPVLLGDAGQAHVLAQAHLDAAELLVLAIPERMAVRRAVEYAHESQRNLPVLARTHSRRDRDLLRAMGVTEVVLGETELALALARRALDRLGVPAAEAESAVNATRADVTRRTAAGS